MRELLIFALVLCGSTVHAQNFTLDCTFHPQHLITVKNGSGAVERDDSRSLVITFTGLNFDKGTAQLVGNSGADNVVMFASNDKLVFIQVTETKNVSVTSMNMPDTKAGPIFGVHSRHMWIANAGVLSQWAGACKIR